MCSHDCFAPANAGSECVSVTCNALRSEEAGSLRPVTVAAASDFVARRIPQRALPWASSGTAPPGSLALDAVPGRWLAAVVVAVAAAAGPGNWQALDGMMRDWRLPCFGTRVGMSPGAGCKGSAALKGSVRSLAEAVARNAGMAVAAAR